MTKIILATESPFRREAFAFLNLPFEAESSDIDEYFEGRPEDPKELVQLLAKLKAEKVAENHKEGIIVGFDSVGYFSGDIMEKPRDRAETFTRLQALSGNSHLYFTGLYLINLATGKIVTSLEEAKVSIRKISDAEISKYLDEDKGEIYLKNAWGYDPLQHYSASFIERYEGSPSNLFGIPLDRVVELLKAVGYKL